MTAGPEGTDEGGVLGNLPRSRPGHRSDKRPEPSATSPEHGDSDGPAPRDPSARHGEGRGPAPARPAFPAPGGGAGDPGGPLGGAARVAGRAARLGLGVAGGVLKRLPRP